MESQNQDDKTKLSEQQLSRNDLVEKYRKYVHGLVGRMIHTMGLPPELYDDFVSAGYLGLVEAAERFDPLGGSDFRRFASFRIRGAVIDSIRASSQIAGKGYRYVKALHAAHEFRDHTFQSTSDTVPGHENVRWGKLLDFIAHGALIHRLSYSDVEQEAAQVILDKPNPEQYLEKKSETKIISQIIATLPEKERTIIEDYYFKEIPFSEIAKRYEGLSKSWVSRLHARALKLLKEQLLALQNQHDL